MSYLYYTMERFSVKFPLYMAFAACLIFAACVQSANLDDLLEASKDIDWDGSGAGGDPESNDGSPELGIDAWSEITPLEKGQVVPLSLGAGTGPSSEIIRVRNEASFNYIEWRWSGGILDVEDGKVFTVDSSNPPFDVKADHLVTVIAEGKNGRPYSTFITVKVLD